LKLTRTHYYLVFYQVLASFV